MVDWGAWDNEAVLVDLLILAGWFYALAAWPLRERFAPGSGRDSRGAVRFFIGLAAFYLAVGPPWERIGRYYLFSVEMLTDLLILYPAAGLMLAGLPPWALDRVLAGRGGRMLRIILHPVVCGTFFVLVTTGGFLPRGYEWAIGSEGRTAVQHVVMLLAGLLLWRPIVARSRLLPPLGFGPRLAYLAAIEVALTAVFLLIIMPQNPMYPTYDLAPRLIAGLSAYSDQILAAVLLAVVSSFVLVGALGTAFFAWARHSQAQEPAYRPGPRG